MFNYENKVMKIIEVIRIAIEKYKISYKDAKYLMGHTLGKDHYYVAMNDQELLLDNIANNFLEFAKQLAEKKPLEYIINRSFFMGLDFYIDEHVLIPRNETEQLVELVLSHVNLTGSKTVLDMCCGSGCILVSLLSLKESLTGIGADISQQAINISQKNASINQIEKRAKFVQSDLFENINDKFDVIISNPPYISTHEMNELESGVADYEPHLALHGGTSGLDFYEKISVQAKNHLNKNGAIFFEIGYNQGKQVCDILKDNGYKDIQLIKDYSGRYRMVWGYG